MGKTNYSVCSFCVITDEPLEHLFLSCQFTTTHWTDIVVWRNNINIKLHLFSDVDKFFGLWKRKEDFLLLNHIIIIAKGYIYYCRKNTLKPSFNAILSRIESMYSINLKVGLLRNHEVRFLSTTEEMWQVCQSQ